MRVFVSSLIRGHEDWRNAARSAVEALGLQAVMAEDFGASPDSARTECLAAVRAADVMILILGSEYGQPMGSGLSATHQEYREARESTSVLGFLHADAVPDADQAGFIREVRDWEEGHYTASFQDADELRDKVLRALYEFRSRQDAAPLDTDALHARAGELLPEHSFGGNPALVLSVACGPACAVLTPSRLNDAALGRHLLGEALTGPFAVLNTSSGTEPSVTADAIVLDQRDTASRVEVHIDGSIVVIQPAMGVGNQFDALPSLVEEDIADRIERALKFSAAVLDHIDPERRISHIAARAGVLQAGHWTWRTRAEQERNPHSVSMSTFPQDRVEANLAPPVRKRATLRMQSRTVAEDLTASLKLTMQRDPWSR